MVIYTSTVFAMRCPDCGKLEIHPISRFSFSGCQVLQINCSCGAKLLLARKKKNNLYYLQIPCVICETEHQRVIKGSRLWSQRVTNLYCQETGIELGHIGPEKEINEVISRLENEVETILHQFDGEDYFTNPNIMFEIINCLHDIAENGALTCQCGNENIEVEIYTDRIELYCRECNSVSIFYAENEEDLAVIKKLDHIQLERNGFKFMDSLANTKEQKRSSKPQYRHNK